MTDKSYSNELLIDTVAKIRQINGEPPVEFRGMQGKSLVFRDENKKKIYYSVADVVNFIEQVNRLDAVAYGDDPILFN